MSVRNTTRKCISLLVAAMAVGAMSALTNAAAIDTVASPTSVDDITGEVYDPPNNSNSAGYYPAPGGQVQVGEVGSAFAPGISRINENGVVGFTLPTLSGGSVITEVELSFTIRRFRNDGNDIGDLQVYLMDTTDPETDIPGSIGTNPIDWFYDGDGNDTRAGVELVGTFDEPTSDFNNNPAVDVTFTVTTGPAMTLFQSFYGGDTTPDQTEAFFRFNSNGNVTVGSHTSEYEVFGTGTNAQNLKITSIPEPAAAALMGVGALLLLPRRRRM